MEVRQEAEAELHFWHLDFFKALGFKRYQAEVLDLAGVLPHDVQDLLRHGCPRDVELLIEILT